MTYDEHSLWKRLEELKTERDRLSACHNNGLDPELLDRIPDLDLENMTLSLECDELERTNARLRGAFNALHQQNGRLLEKEKELREQRVRLREALQQLIDQYERDVPKRKRPLTGYGTLTRARAALQEAGDD